MGKQCNKRSQTKNKGIMTTFDYIEASVRLSSFSKWFYPICSKSQTKIRHEAKLKLILNANQAFEKALYANNSK